MPTTVFKLVLALLLALAPAGAFAQSRIPLTLDPSGSTISKGFTVPSGQTLELAPGASLNAAAGTISVGGVVIGNATKTAFIDGTNGIAAGVIGDPNRAFASPATAAEALKLAGGGGLAFVRAPGLYNVTTSLARNGVNWYLCEGSTIARSNTLNSQGIFDDGNTASPPVATAAMSYRVSGAGTLSFHDTSAPNKFDSRCGAIAVRNSSSAVVVELDSIYTTTDNNTTGGPTVSAAIQENGHMWLFLKKEARSMCRGWTWAWLNGEGFIHCPKSYGDDYNLWGEVNSTPTGDFYFRGDLLHAGHSEPVYHTSHVASAVMWVESLVIKGDRKANVCHGGKTYFTFQKTFGGFAIAPQNTVTKVYITGQKVEALDGFEEGGSDGSPLSVRAYEGTDLAEVYLNVLEWDLAGKENPLAMFYLTYPQGKVFWNQGRIRGYTDEQEEGTEIWNISGGIDVTFSGVTFDPSGSARAPLKLGDSGTVRVVGSVFLGEDSASDFDIENAGATLLQNGNLGSGANGAVRIQSGGAGEPEIATIADWTAASLADGDYVSIWDATGRWNFYWNVDGGSGAPAVGGTNVLVADVDSMTVVGDDLRDALVTAINGSAAAVTALDIGEGVMRVTDDADGSRTNATTNNSGVFTITTTQQGTP
jgi:hypothetical protein